MLNYLIVHFVLCYSYQNNMSTSPGFVGDESLGKLNTDEILTTCFITCVKIV